MKKKRNLFKLEEENKPIKDKIIIDIINLLELKNDDYYKLERVWKFFITNYIEYESNGDRHKNILIEEYLDNTKPYLKYIIIHLQKSDTWEIHLTISINYISSKDTNREQRMHPESDNIEVVTYDKCKWNYWRTFWLDSF